MNHKISFYFFVFDVNITYIVLIKTNGGSILQNGLLHLYNIINVDNFQKIQDNIAEVTDIAMVTVDYKGKRVTTHSGCNEFCKFK